MEVSNQWIKITIYFNIRKVLFYYKFLLFHANDLIQSYKSGKDKKSILEDVTVISLILQAIELHKKIGLLKTVDATQQFGLYLLPTYV